MVPTGWPLGFWQACKLSTDGESSASAQNERVIRVIKVFRILRIMRVLKLAKFVRRARPQPLPHAADA